MACFFYCTAEKAGAVEIASSTNGQLMLPIMGAAAFLMVEYVGVSYLEVIKHAFLPVLVIWRQKRRAQV